jgi:uncharacterized RDD family membrane protein YckC
VAKAKRKKSKSKSKKKITHTPDVRVDEPAYRVAPFGLRLLALVLDLIVMGVLMNMIWFTHRTGADGHVASPPWWMILVVPLYEIVLAVLLGATPGKRFVGLRMVDYPSEGLLNIRQILIRFCVKWGVPFVLASYLFNGSLSDVFAFAGALTTIVVFGSIIFDSQRRGFHDRLANVVVRRVRVDVR